MKSCGRIIAGLAILISVFGCSGSANAPRTENRVALIEPSIKVTERTPPQFRFQDVAQASEIVWTARNGEEAGEFTILETFGSGCAAVDFDRDGRLDLLVGGGGTISSKHEIGSLPIALYRQIADWQFSNLATSAGLSPIRHYHHGMWTTDCDHDGFDDLLITGWSGLQLFHNQGDGTFIDVTSPAGLEDREWSVAAAWVDLNQDQQLDLFIGHYVDWSFANHPVCVDTRLSQRMICDPTRFQGLPCLVYLNNGNGTFRQGNEELGIQGIGKTLGVVAADLNGDQRPEVYVANDTTANQLYQRQADGMYRETGIETGVAFGEAGSPDGSMGVEVGDIDGDGQPDLWVANFENQTFALYRNLGHDLFMHSSRMYGVAAVGSEAVGFGTLLFDADADSYPDIFCANGHVSAPNTLSERRQRPFLFWNDRGRQLVEVAARSGDYLGERHLARGCAWGDFDRNGSLDVAITHANEPVALLRNDTPQSHWLIVELVGTVSSRSAIGATVTLINGDRKQWGTIKGGGSYLSTSEPVVHFGLGEQLMINRLEVQWPSGRHTVLTGVAPNQRLRIVEDNTN